MEAAERLAERMFEVPAVRAARTVLSFSSFGSEVPTEAIARRLRGQETRVLLPYLEEREIQAAAVVAGDPLVATTYGPMEPAARIPVDPQEVEVVLVPGLAFDRRGYRVGYGGGHYDRFLTRLQTQTLRIGIAFDGQIVPSVPHGPEDEPVDLVVTDRRTIDSRAEREARSASER
jgi:5-formyltetrahydrofolate cyclo-ligase